MQPRVPREGAASPQSLLLVLPPLSHVGPLVPQGSCRPQAPECIDNTQSLCSQADIQESALEIP